MITAKTNVDAYNLLISLCKRGYRQDIQRGSFAGEESVYRMQARPCMVEIKEPLNFLYLPKDCTLGMIQTYYSDYIVNDDLREHEQYTYGNRIMEQLDSVMAMLKETPNTNQASISVSQPSDIEIEHPPCLRLIDFKVFDNKLHMSSFWRSNDILEAFLINVCGLSLLLQDVAELAELEIGSHYYASSGSHLYIREEVI